MSKLEDKLQERVEIVKQAVATRQKARYTLARKLGFNALEATVLDSWPEDKIRELAKERGYQEP